MEMGGGNRTLVDLTSGGGIDADQRASFRDLPDEEAYILATYDSLQARVLV